MQLMICNRTMATGPDLIPTMVVLSHSHLHESLK